MVVGLLQKPKTGASASSPLDYESRTCCCANYTAYPPDSVSWCKRQDGGRFSVAPAFENAMTKALHHERGHTHSPCLHPRTHPRTVSLLRRQGPTIPLHHPAALYHSHPLSKFKQTERPGSLACPYYNTASSKTLLAFLRPPAYRHQAAAPPPCSSLAAAAARRRHHPKGSSSSSSSNRRPRRRAVARARHSSSSSQSRRPRSRGHRRRRKRMRRPCC